MTAAAGATKPLSPLTLNVFPGGFNWPCFAALDKGLFAANDLEVTLQATTNSVAQMTGLANGAFDIAMTAVDNIVAYVEGQGEAPIGPQPGFFAFMGSDNGFLSLVACPEIKCIEDLKGKTLSVDARTTGYAFVLLDMLRRGGLAESDYEIIKVGGTGSALGSVAQWQAGRNPAVSAVRHSGFSPGTQQARACDQHDRPLSSQRRRRQAILGNGA
jgi:ABC-type nitrate/sulfonate/bicarbonate transport system substrate-binding protein